MISSTAAAITSDAIQQQRERQLQAQQELVEQQKLFARHTQGTDGQSPTASQLGSRQPTFTRDFSLGRGDGVNRPPTGGRNGPTGSMLRPSGSDMQQLTHLVEERASPHFQAGPRVRESRMSLAKAAAAGGSVSPIGRLVDIILFLTKDKSGATPRIMRKLANEALVEEMPRSGSTSCLPAEVVGSAGQDASHASHTASPLALASADVDEIKKSLARSTAPKPGRMEQLVPKVFTFDLFGACGVAQVLFKRGKGCSLHNHHALGPSWTSHGNVAVSPTRPLHCCEKLSCWFVLLRVCRGQPQVGRVHYVARGGALCPVRCKVPQGESCAPRDYSVIVSSGACGGCRQHSWSLGCHVPQWRL